MYKDSVPFLQMIRVYSFLEYVMGGCQINFSVSTNNMLKGVRMHLACGIGVGSVGIVVVGVGVGIDVGAGAGGDVDNGDSVVVLALILVIIMVV